MSQNSDADSMMDEDVEQQIKDLEQTIQSSKGHHHFYAVVTPSIENESQGIKTMFKDEQGGGLRPCLLWYFKIGDGRFRAAYITDLCDFLCVLSPESRPVDLFELRH